MSAAELAPQGLTDGVGSRAARAILIAYGAALIAAEATVRLFSVEVSLAFYAIVLFALLSTLALVSTAGTGLQKGLLGLALVALLKVGAIALPQRLVPAAYWGAFPAALALLVVCALMRLRNGVPGRLRRPRPLPRLAFGLQLAIAATGPLFALAGALALSLVDSSVARPAFVSTPATVLLVAAFSGAVLELVFRGILQPALVGSFGRSGIALASLLYASLFLGTGSTFLVVLGAVTGLAWGLLAARTKSASGAAMSHALFAVTWAALR